MEWGGVRETKKCKVRREMRGVGKRKRKGRRGRGEEEMEGGGRSKRRSGRGKER